MIRDETPQTRYPRTAVTLSAPRPARSRHGALPFGAGYTRFRRVAETPFNIIYELRP